jgi:hypothetical protein
VAQRLPAGGEDVFQRADALEEVLVGFHGSVVAGFTEPGSAIFWRRLTLKKTAVILNGAFRGFATMAE